MEREIIYLLKFEEADTQWQINQFCRLKFISFRKNCCTLTLKQNVYILLIY